MNQTVAAALLFGAVVSSSAFAARAFDQAGAQQQRDLQPVLLVTVDTLRADAIGVAGGVAATPAIDALAARGVRFDNAVAHTVMTLPSHTAILTGLDPTHHGVHDNSGFRVRDDIETWAERLHAQGYATGAFVGAFPLDSQFGLSQGFDVYDDYYGAPENGSLRMVERPADAVVAIARRWIRRQRGPWFAWVHVYDPHAPHLPPPPFDERYPDDAYAGEIAFSDSALQPILRDAERRGAIVVFTSDHGEAFGDHQERTHGIFAYAATLRVPLILAGIPGITPGAVEADRIAHEDILPTVLDALGLSRAGTQGTSFLARMQGTVPADDSRLVYFESLGPNLTRNWAPLRGVLRDQWKYIDLPVPELYDVEADPRERDNLAAQKPILVDDLRAALQKYVAAGIGSEQPRPEDPETSRRLRALGYLGGSTGAAADREGAEYGPEDDPKALIHYDNELQDAILAAESGDLNGALARVEGVLDDRPDYGAAYLLYANFQSALGNTGAAVERLKVAAAGSWSTPGIWVKLAFYLGQMGRFDEAREQLEDALTEQPDNVDALIQLGTILGESGDPTGAQAAFDRAAELDPTSASLHVNEGALLLSQGQLEPAETSLQLALQYDPTSSESHNLLGVIAFDSDRKEEALEHWRTAIALSDTNYQAMNNLGINLVRMNRFAEAVKVLDQLIASVPPPLQDEYQIEQLRTMVARIKADQGLR